MAKKKRILAPLKAALVLLPVAGVLAWLLVDSTPERDTEREKQAARARMNAAHVTVIVSAGGEPVEAAHIVVLSHSTRRAVQARRTDQQGRVELDGLPPGKTTIGVRMSGYERAKRELNLPAKARQTVKINLEAGQDASDAGPEPPPAADDPEADQSNESGRNESAETRVYGKLELQRPVDDLVVRLCSHDGDQKRDRCVRTRRYKGQPKSFELLQVPAGRYDVVFLRDKEELKRVPVVVNAGRSVEVAPQVL